MVREIRRYFNYLKSQFGRRGDLNFLILYATSRCNLACQTCFFHQNLNKQNDLILEEYHKIAQSLGRVSLLGIGGGEPFLNKDLVKICSIFIEKAKVDSLFIPTNGVLTKEIVSQTEILLEKFPQTSISINPSLDGMAQYHDQNRGLNGVFDQVIKTIKELSKLKSKYPNLQIVANSVINQDNLEDLKKLMIFLRQFDLDFHAFEIMRGDQRNKSLGLPDLRQIKEMHQLILKNRFWYLKKRAKFLNRLEEIAVLGVLRYSQIFKERSLVDKNWPNNCRAGRNIAAVYPDGQLALCELRLPLINLRKINYDLGGFLKSPEVLREIKKIKKQQCHCTHICFIHSAIAISPLSAFRVFYYYLKSLSLIKND